LLLGQRAVKLAVLTLLWHRLYQPPGFVLRFYCAVK
jgi:hypothetical protein